MSEKKEGTIDLTAAQKKLAETLKGIGTDLWGGNPDLWAEKTFEDAAAPEKKDKKQPEKTEKTAKKTDIQTLWKTADETVDWTDALIHASPRDGLTSQKNWMFFRRMAGRVLEGDRDAYVEVLTSMNPLGDLTDYVSGMIIRTPSSDRLECVFECRSELMEENPRIYLGGLGLRIGRDLLAVLPVEEVCIVGNQDGKERLNVTFRREQLLKQKMAFLDPAEFTERCGGRIQCGEKSE